MTDPVSVRSARHHIVVLVNRPPSSPGQFDSIRAHADLTVVRDTADLTREIRYADALCVWDSQPDQVDAAILASTRLRWIHSSSTGVNDLITPLLHRSSITLTNSRGVLDRAIAEYVLGLYLAHRKGFAVTLNQQRERRWEHHTTLMVAGTRAVVVGTGAIGRETATLLRAVGVHVSLVGRRAIAQDPVFGEIIASSELARAVVGAQLVVLAAPLTPETRHILGMKVLEAMASDAYLVNIGRGGLVDEPALITHLAAGRIAGAGLDVFNHEPLPRDSRLWGDPSVFVSPHMAGDFVGFEEALTERFVGLLRDWCAGRPLRHIVDTNIGYVPSGEEITC
jgi:phosphoglycerate dehydrogenase-like enzyme